jgi:hypothetical protein
MPDGKRKRRHSQDRAKRRWYAFHRSCRFRRRFFTPSTKADTDAPIASIKDSLLAPIGLTAICAPIAELGRLGRRLG